MTGITDKFQSFVIDRLMGALAHSTKRPPSNTIYPPTPIPGVKQVQCLLYRKECIGWMPGH